MMTGPDGEATDADRRTVATGRKAVRWTKKMQNAFLDHLASTCHVAESAAAAGVDPASLYRLRRRDPTFAESWGAALAAGYEMLETLVVGHVVSGSPARAIDGGRYGPIDLDQALRLLTLHRGAMHGKPPRDGKRPRRATRDETDAALLKKLIAIEKREGLG